jgi:hypothetical protein
MAKERDDDESPEALICVIHFCSFVRHERELTVACKQVAFVVVYSVFIVTGVIVAFIIVVKRLFSRSDLCEQRDTNKCRRW